MAVIVNTAIGLSVLILGILAACDHPKGRWLTEAVRRKGQELIGEYWHVHEFIVGGVLVIVGLFFLFVSVTIYAKAHDFWVLRWF